MKVLVTGITGRVGANVARILIEQGHDVRGLVMRDDPQLPKLDLLGDIDVVTGTLGSQADCDRAVAGTDLIVHLAAQLVRGDTAVDDFYDVNAISTLRLLEAGVHHAPRLRRFVLASTDGTYRPGRPPTRPISETSEQKPADYYGTSKLLSEIILRNHAEQFGIEFSIVRFGTVVSPEEAPAMFRRDWIRALLDRARLGADTNLWPLFRNHPHLVDSVPRQQPAVNPPTSIVGPTGAAWSLHLVDVRDAARGTVTTAFHPLAAGEDFMIVGPTTTPFDVGAQAVAEKHETVDRLQLATDWNLDIDGSKARHLLGFEPHYSFADTVAAGANRAELTTVIPARLLLSDGTGAAHRSHDIGTALWEQARGLIPGGTQLLGKRPEMFLPGGWPAYYQRAAGCRLRDVDGHEYIDMTTTGIGACLLGYSDPDVNAAAKRAIDNASLTSLNPPDEVALASRLVDIIPWADKVRFARTGGEAMSIAVRIARARSGRDTVAVCGYHGWSDWYIAANLGDSAALDGHLLPGLQPSGVPRALRGSALPFAYNRIEQLEDIVARHGEQLGAIVMEPLRFDEPTDGFLERVREIADRLHLVLVFDEITAGWRHNFGGAHQILGVEPDIAVFAKSLANGFPMAAVIGRNDVMEAAQSSFISSTYWTEAIGPAAALKTLQRMQESNVSDHVRAIGQQLQDGMAQCADVHGISLGIGGRPALTRIEFEHGSDSLAMRTLFTQHMLDRGYLASGAFYPTLAHTSEVVAGYLDATGEAFAQIAAAIHRGGIRSELRGPVAHVGFHRLA